MAPEPGDLSALVDELLQSAAGDGDAPRLAERVLALGPAEARATASALGRSRQPAAAPILLALAESAAGSKDLRKEARRGLHHLRALGLEVPRPTPPLVVAPLSGPPAKIVEAWATSSDGVGSRALWLMAERPQGGVYAVAMVLNEVVGMKACSVDEMTRKRFRARFDQWRAQSGLEWVPLPPAYAQQLVGEALELNRASGFTVPRDYLAHQQVLNAVRPFEQALIYAELPAAEAMLDPALLADSAELLDEEELKGWFFGFDEVRGFALDLLQARQSQIVLSEQHRAEREQRIIANAIRDVLTPPLQHGLQRRLEETAYLFLKTDRGLQARRALAAAQRLAEGATTLHPLLQAMMAKSLELAAEVETAKVPIELVRRSPYDPIE